MSAGFGRSQAASCASQSGGNVSSGSADRSSTIERREVLELDLARVGRVAAAAEQQADGARAGSTIRQRCPGPCGRRAGRTRGPRTSRRSRRRGAQASTATRSGRGPRAAGRAPGAARRRSGCAAGARDSVQCHVVPSSMRRPRALRSANRVAASSSRSRWSPWSPIANGAPGAEGGAPSGRTPVPVEPLETHDGPTASPTADQRVFDRPTRTARTLRRPADGLAHHACARCRDAPCAVGHRVREAGARPLPEEVNRDWPKSEWVRTRRSRALSAASTRRSSRVASSPRLADASTTRSPL